MKNTKDENIRKVLKSLLVEELRQIQGETGCPARVFSELGVDHGVYRVDVVTVNDIIHGYEIKSDADDLKRLPEQAEAYSRVFGRVTLVVGETYIIRALSIIPDWWGVKLAKGNPNGTASLSDIREALDNKSQDILSVARLLWRQEALDILKTRNVDFGVRTKRREFIYERLAAVMNIVDLQNVVRDKLFTRQDWRSDQPLLQYDG
ncbi:MAG: sce7726 family protein [Clostridiales bacterium]|nr:sce7726 family protein [Clostridiales bacterium]